MSSIHKYIPIFLCTRQKFALHSLQNEHNSQWNLVIATQILPYASTPTSTKSALAEATAAFVDGISQNDNRQLLFHQDSFWMVLFK